MDGVSSTYQLRELRALELLVASALLLCWAKKPILVLSEMFVHFDVVQLHIKTLVEAAVE